MLPSAPRSTLMARSVRLTLRCDAAAKMPVVRVPRSACANLLTRSGWNTLRLDQLLPYCWPMYQLPAHSKRVYSGCGPLGLASSLTRSLRMTNSARMTGSLHGLQALSQEELRAWLRRMSDGADLLEFGQATAHPGKPQENFHWPIRQVFSRSFEKSGLNGAVELRQETDKHALLVIDFPLSAY